VFQARRLEVRFGGEPACALRVGSCRGPPRFRLITPIEQRAHCPRRSRARRCKLRGRPISTLYLERIGPVFDREDSALFDHDLMGRDRRARRLGGLHLARNFRLVERGSGSEAGSRGDNSSCCSQNDDLAHGVTLCGVVNVVIAFAYRRRLSL